MKTPCLIDRADATRQGLDQMLLGSRNATALVFSPEAPDLPANCSRSIVLVSLSGSACSPEFSAMKPIFRWSGRTTKSFDNSDVRARAHTALLDLNFKCRCGAMQVESYAACQCLAQRCSRWTVLDPTVWSSRTDRLCRAGYPDVTCADVKPSHRGISQPLPCTIRKHKPIVSQVDSCFLAAPDAISISRTHLKHTRMLRDHTPGTTALPKLFCWRLCLSRPYRGLRILAKKLNISGMNAAPTTLSDYSLD
ncbi:hypothetical protein EJ03DRAFT_188997 [Teratosphaeria nubilosa]|uniref:Uncharacterized protein n=1 Tax=Teratosphaeria nubilosa TaxID=161662 RepID=A0A6G1LI36_9PEZI|nr:hypothetical protein EJ03DRAFT_188997 [Teratosphaeria nubilosa]